MLLENHPRKDVSNEGKKMHPHQHRGMKLLDIQGYIQECLQLINDIAAHTRLDSWPLRGYCLLCKRTRQRVDGGGGGSGDGRKRSVIKVMPHKSDAQSNQSSCYYQHIFPMLDEY